MPVGSFRLSCPNCINHPHPPFLPSAVSAALWLGCTVLALHLSPTPLWPQIYWQPQRHTLFSPWLLTPLHHCLDSCCLSWPSRNWLRPPYPVILHVERCPERRLCNWLGLWGTKVLGHCTNHTPVMSGGLCSAVLWNIKFRVVTTLIKHIPSKTETVGFCEQTFQVAGTAEVDETILECTLWLCLLFHIFSLWFPSKYHTFTISSPSPCTLSPFKFLAWGKPKTKKGNRQIILPCFPPYSEAGLAFQRELYCILREKTTKLIKYRKA